MSDKLFDFISDLAAEKLPGMFNPWADMDDLDLNDFNFDNPIRQRKQRLLRHLICYEPKLLLIGEAPGYQGCRFSGIPFTSERLLFEGSIPRLENQAGQRITVRNKPWSEPSATIVWKALFERGIANYTVMFNAVPWHPEGSKGPLSNRTPTEKERAAGVPYLIRFIELFDGVQIAALGNTASASLTQLGIHHTKLRHPANGGATKFRNGLKELM